MDYSAYKYLDKFTIRDLSYLVISHPPPTPTGSRDPNDPHDAIHHQADLLAEQMIADATVQPAKLEAHRRDIGDSWELTGGDEWVVTRKAALDYCDAKKWRPPFLYPEEKTESPLQDRARDSLLIIIAALAKEAGIDVAKPSKSGEVIAALTQQLGSPVSATTVENYLKLIGQAIEKRSK